MPKIAIYKYFVFFIVAYDLRERFHLHVVKTKGRKSKVAKIWLEPIEVFEKGDLTQAEINLVCKLIEKNRVTIKNKIISFAKRKKVKGNYS